MNSMKKKSLKMKSMKLIKSYGMLNVKQEGFGIEIRENEKWSENNKKRYYIYIGETIAYREYNPEHDDEIFTLWGHKYKERKIGCSTFQQAQEEFKKNKMALCDKYQKLGCRPF